MNQTIEILHREQFADNSVAYTIQTTSAIGNFHKEECVRIRDGKPNGCTCKDKRVHNVCQHQEALVRVEAEYQNH